MAYRYFKDKPITLVVQDSYILQRYPGFMHRKYARGYRWIGKLRPTPLSVEYEVEIKYEIGRLPKAYVLSPKLHSYNGKAEIPHIYKDDDEPRPCLFLPFTREWYEKRLIAETVIPWLSLWLFFYEVWLSTGEWLGEGVHPEPKNESTENNI